MAISRENAIRKVRALLAVAAPGSGATEAEKETARNLAAKLVAQYGLTGQEVAAPPAAPPPRAPTPTDDVVIVVNLGGFGFNAGNAAFWSFGADLNSSSTTTGGW